MFKELKEKDVNIENGYTSVLKRKEYLCDTEDDIEDLPKRDEIAWGSTAKVISSSKTYILNSQDEWVESIQSGGSSGGNTSNLATVATSGDYNDLLNKPVYTEFVLSDEQTVLINNETYTISIRPSEASKENWYVNFIPSLLSNYISINYAYHIIIDGVDYGWLIPKEEESDDMTLYYIGLSKEDLFNANFTQGQDLPFRLQGNPRGYVTNLSFLSQDYKYQENVTIFLSQKAKQNVLHKLSSGMVDFSQGIQMGDAYLNEDKLTRLLNLLQ